MGTLYWPLLYLYVTLQLANGPPTPTQTFIETRSYHIVSKALFTTSSGLWQHIQMCQSLTFALDGIKNMKVYHEQA